MKFAKFSFLSSSTVVPKWVSVTFIAKVKGVILKTFACGLRPQTPFPSPANPVSFSPIHLLTTKGHFKRRYAPPPRRDTLPQGPKRSPTFKVNLLTKAHQKSRASFHGLR